MADDVYATRELIVTRYIGPAGDDRTRWQFTPVQAEFAVLQRNEVWRLIDLLLHDLAGDPPSEPL